MAAVIRCDQCNKDCQDRQRIRVTVQSPDYRSMFSTERVVGLDFCSRACAAGFNWANWRM